MKTWEKIIAFIMMLIGFCGLIFGTIDEIQNPGYSMTFQEMFQGIPN